MSFVNGGSGVKKTKKTKKSKSNAKKVKKTNKKTKTQKTKRQRTKRQKTKTQKTKSKPKSRSKTRSKAKTKSKKKSKKNNMKRKHKRVVIGNSKNTNAQLNELNELENNILKRRNIEQQIYKDQMRSNMKLNKKYTPLKMTSIKRKNSIVPLAVPMIASSINKISIGDISNIDSEIRASTLLPPSSYDSLSPQPAYEIDDAEPTIKQMSMMDDDDEANALSYRNEDLNYRD
jgi:hypothetical protein